MSTLDETSRAVDVTAHDLPLACPRPGAPLWARHPRVFIDVLKAESGAAACPIPPDRKSTRLNSSH